MTTPPTPLGSGADEGTPPAVRPVDEVAAVLGAECRALAAALAGLPAEDWSRPTACVPWDVRELLAHVAVTLAWLPTMLDGPAPDRADVSAVEYYRPDDRFSQTTDQRRIDLARERASDDAADPVGAFTALADDVLRRVLAEPPGRVVVTRHGDAMLLADFLTTRVVEVAVHGLDLAHALGTDPWLTPEADAHLRGLLLVDPTAPDVLGWDGATFLASVTGRRPAPDGEAMAALRTAGLRELTLG